jgi:hypothetical protein
MTAEWLGGSSATTAAAHFMVAVVSKDRGAAALGRTREVDQTKLCVRCEVVA